MNNRKPPALATWMLDHLRSRGSDEALSGDLLEAFRTGRSAGWYLYQVIAAIAIAWERNVWHHRVTLFFAAVWSVFSPAWVLLPVRFSLDSLVGDTSHIPWPWSLICAMVFGAVIAMLFIWLGVAVYSTLHLLAHGNLSLRSIRKGFLWGLVAYGLRQHYEAIPHVPFICELHFQLTDAGCNLVPLPRTPGNSKVLSPTRGLGSLLKPILAPGFTRFLQRGRIKTPLRYPYVVLRLLLNPAGEHTNSR